MTSEQLAWKICRHDVEMTHISGGSHIGAVMSIADIMGVLYADVLHYRPEEPKWDGRDRLILSKGHAGAALYAALAECGFFPVEELLTYYQNESRLSGHISHKVPGIEMSTGSLGQGFSVCVGMALANKMNQDPGRVYTLLGDGELQEGLIWEAAMAAGHYKLDNLVAIVDWNGLQIDGNNDDVITVKPIDEKFAAFGFNVIVIDGHNFEEIFAAFDAARACEGKPTAIIAKTHKGQGVSFMADQAGWHGKAPNADEAKQAVEELGGEW